MRMTTLCYIEKDDCYLMLHRVKKKNDINHGKWIGVGGHFEDRESPEECLLREVFEETGLTLISWKFRGIITFLSDGYPTEYMCLYTSDKFTGNLKVCNEGELEWIKKKEIMKLNLWEGDKIFLQYLLNNYPFFSMKLSYTGDELKECIVDGKVISTAEDLEKMIQIVTNQEEEIRDDCYNIGELVGEIVEEIEKRFGKNKVQIIHIIDEKVPRNLSGDAGKIRKVVRKLIQSSICYAGKNAFEQGSITIKIKCKQATYATWLNIEIDNSKIKMEEQEILDIKNYLERGKKNLKESEEIAGNGFFVIGHLVEQMAGTIEVMSKENKGMKFVINIPQLEA